MVCQEVKRKGSLTSENTSRKFWRGNSGNVKVESLALLCSFALFGQHYFSSSSAVILGSQFNMAGITKPFRHKPVAP